MLDFPDCDPNQGQQLRAILMEAAKKHRQSVYPKYAPMLQAPNYIGLANGGGKRQIYRIIFLKFRQFSFVWSTTDFCRYVEENYKYYYLFTLIYSKVKTNVLFSGRLLSYTIIFSEIAQCEVGGCLGEIWQTMDNGRPNSELGDGRNPNCVSSRKVVRTRNVEPDPKSDIGFDFDKRN